MEESREKKNEALRSAGTSIAGDKLKQVSRMSDSGAVLIKPLDGPKKVGKGDTLSEEEEEKNKRKEWKIQEVPQDYGFLSTLGVTLWLGWNGFLVYLSLFLIAFAYWMPWMVWTIVGGLCTVSLAVPRDFPRTLGFKLGDWMTLQAEKYFGLKTVIEDEAAIISLSNQDKSAIFAFEPHDILPYPVFCFNPVLKRVPGTILQNGQCLMTSAVFRLPFMRQIYTWMQGSPIDKQTFKGKLDRGESFAFVPGGVQEVTLIDPQKPDELVLYLQSRKGFVKMALATGSPIVPTFGFNIDGSYGYWIPRGTLITKVGRMIGFLPLFFWGRFYIPFGIPNPQQIHVVMGKPIDVPFEGDNVKDESVVKYHALFLREMEALFERHKDEAGYGHRSLKIL